MKIYRELGYTEVPVSLVNLSEEDEKRLNLALNKTGGAWDASKLDSLLAELVGVDIPGFEPIEMKTVNMEEEILAEQEFDIARNTAESAAEIIREKLLKLANECPEKFNKAIGIILPASGGNTVFILVDFGVKDMISELKRYEEAGEHSPLECLLKSVYRMDTK